MTLPSLISVSLIELKTLDDDMSKMFEPKGIVLSEIVPLYRNRLREREAHIAITSIVKLLKCRGYIFDERKVTQLARQLGFTIVKPQNKEHIKVEGEAKLKAILDKAGVSEDFEEETDTSIKCLHLSSAVN